MLSILRTQINYYSASFLMKQGVDAAAALLERVKARCCSADPTLAEGDVQPLVALLRAHRDDSMQLKLVSETIQDLCATSTKSSVRQALAGLHCAEIVMALADQHTAVNDCCLSLLRTLSALCSSCPGTPSSDTVVSQVVANGGLDFCIRHLSKSLSQPLRAAAIMRLLSRLAKSSPCEVKSQLLAALDLVLPMTARHGSTLYVVQNCLAFAFHMSKSSLAPSTESDSEVFLHLSDDIEDLRLLSGRHLGDSKVTKYLLGFFWNMSLHRPECANQLMHTLTLTTVQSALALHTGDIAVVHPGCELLLQLSVSAENRPALISTIETLQLVFSAGTASSDSSISKSALRCLANFSRDVDESAGRMLLAVTDLALSAWPWHSTDAEFTKLLFRLMANLAISDAWFYPSIGIQYHLRDQVEAAYAAMQRPELEGDPGVASEALRFLTACCSVWDISNRLDMLALAMNRHVEDEEMAAASLELIFSNAQCEITPRTTLFNIAISTLLHHPNNTTILAKGLRALSRMNYEVPDSRNRYPPTHHRISELKTDTIPAFMSIAQLVTENRHDAAVAASGLSLLAPLAADNVYRNLFYPMVTAIGDVILCHPHEANVAPNGVRLLGALVSFDSANAQDWSLFIAEIIVRILSCNDHIDDYLTAALALECLQNVAENSATGQLKLISALDITVAAMKR
jgi:hypothetical protein